MACLTSLYISILVSSSSRPTSFSLLTSHSPRFFSAIKIYAHSRTRCVHIAFRLAQCSFCARLRTRSKRAFVHTHTYTDVRSEIWSRLSLAFFPPRPEFDKFICLCGSRSGGISPTSSDGKSTKSKRTRQRDHRWRFPFNGIAMIPPWKLALLFIEIRMTLKKNKERDGRRRGAVSSNHPTKQKASG